MKGYIREHVCRTQLLLFSMRTMKKLLVPPGLASIPEDDDFTFISGSSSPSYTPPLTPLATPHDSPSRLSLASGNDLEMVASDGIKFHTCSELLQAVR